jgi:hypothetical protein
LDPEALKQYIKNNPDKTLKEIGAGFGQVMLSYLRESDSLGLPIKKSYYTRSGMKKSGEHSRNSSAKSK